TSVSASWTVADWLVLICRTKKLVLSVPGGRVTLKGPVMPLWPVMSTSALAVLSKLTDRSTFCGMPALRPAPRGTCTRLGALGTTVTDAWLGWWPGGQGTGVAFTSAFTVA